jgi:divalent metal cation (Fe/Co/Zn/Cd) transporter
MTPVPLIVHAESKNSRHADLRTAILLTYITLAWMTLEGASSVLLGWFSGSLILTAFGIDSGIELFSAGLLLWRLRAEAAASANEKEIEAVERRASRWAGFALLALAAYIVASSTVGLLRHHKIDSHRSVWGIAIGVIAAVGMPLLAKSKLRIAAPDRLNSKALRADAMEAFTCGYLSWIMIAGLAFTYTAGWWWADRVAALGLLPFLIKEAREAIQNECCCGQTG